MKTIILICFFGVVAVLARPEDKYTDRYDNIDLDEVLDNPRILKGYVECALGKGKCLPDAKELKEHIIDALETECKKCTDKQREGTRRVISHLINKEPEYWKQLNDKYDPDQKFTKKYEKELKEIQQ